MKGRIEADLGNIDTLMAVRKYRLTLPPVTLDRLYGGEVEKKLIDIPVRAGLVLLHFPLWSDLLQSIDILPSSPCCT